MSMRYCCHMTSIASPAAETRCRRCKRPLKSLASKLAGIGGRCAAIEAATEGLTSEQSSKALDLVSDGGVAKVREGVYQVTSSDGEATYLASVKGPCSCRWGLKRKSALTKVCVHVAAARLTARPVIRRSLCRSQFAKVA